MPPTSWSHPAVLLVSPSLSTETESLRAAAADAAAIYGADQAAIANFVAVRPDLPLIVIADLDEPATLDLVAQGIDAVLPANASMLEIAKAARHGMARKRRRERPAPQPEGVARTFPNAPQLQQIARLAGGIAHEFNNLLTVIEGNVDHLLQSLTDMPTRQSADAIGMATRRAAALTRQLLAFGRQQTLIAAPVNVNHIVSEAAPVLRNAMGKHVRVVTELASDVPQVRVDAEQMTEVLSNLAATALEAMPHGGTFTIATDTYMVADEERRHRPWLPSGRFVRLLVSDTGSGIEEHALPHLFEPFYSANGGWRGTGLTMSSVYGVVKQSGGFIWVDSHVNQGTRVTILLPPLELPNGGGRHDLPRRTPARILLVEDTDAVRETLTSILEMNNFAVTPACTAEEASEFARTLRFDLLLTDVALPGRSGPELAREFRDLYPATPVLFMSGHSANTMDPRDLDTPRSFLQKPFSGQTLVTRIREVLGQPAAASTEGPGA